jgi:CBS domain-containing protein
VNAAEIMTRDVATVLPTATLTEVARTMAAISVRGLPVCEPDGTLMGIIAACDLIGPPARDLEQRHGGGWLHHLVDRKHLAREFFHHANGDEICARDQMQADVVSATETTPVEEIVDLMMTRDFNRVPIVRDGKLVGIVTRADLAKMQARPQSAGEMAAGEMSAGEIDPIIITNRHATKWPEDFSAG